jgi:hypothetical protein
VDRVRIGFVLGQKWLISTKNWVRSAEFFFIRRPWSHFALSDETYLPQNA